MPSFQWLPGDYEIAVACINIFSEISTQAKPVSSQLEKTTKTGQTHPSLAFYCLYSIINLYTVIIKYVRQLFNSFLP